MTGKGGEEGDGRLAANEVRRISAATRATKHIGTDSAQIMIEAPLVGDDLFGFAESERPSYTLMINKILSLADTKSHAPKRLHEAVAKNRNAATRETISVIKEIVLEHFLGRTCQHKLLHSPTHAAAGNAVVSTNQGSANKVFTTPELLEGILSHLSATELVQISRVSKTFCAITRTSPILRSKLFLRPVQPTTIIELSAGPTRPEFKGLEPSKFVKAELNPLLRTMKSSPEEEYYEEPWSQNGHHVHLGARLMRAACWTDMYLTNPPCVLARIIFTYSSRHSAEPRPLPKHYHILAERTVHQRHGITIAVIMEAMHSKGGVKIIENVNGRRATIWYVKDTTTAEEVQKCEAKTEGCKMELVFDETDVEVVGIALPTERDSQRWRTFGMEMAVRHV